LPIADFQDEPVNPFVGAPEGVGELETIDNLLADESGRPPRRRRAGRRPRHD
jgi:hypothetical protein